MDATIPTPPDDTNPYLFYSDRLHGMTVLTPSDPAGFRARLIVLYLLCALLLVSSMANFMVHALSYHAKGRRLWLFKLVKRGPDNGTHIVSNHFLLCTLGGLVFFVIIFGTVHNLWRATISPGFGAGQEHLAQWSFALWPLAYAIAWLLSWATFQTYLQVEGGTTRIFGRSWMVMPAWLENTLFIGGGIATVSVHTTLAAIGSAANAEQWRQYRVLDRMLSSEAASWTAGPVPADTAQTLLSLMGKYMQAAEHFYCTSSNLSIGAAVLPVFLVLINLAMIFFVLTIRRHIRFQISQLPSLQAVSPVAFNAELTPQGPLVVPLPSVPGGIVEAKLPDDVKEELSPLDQGRDHGPTPAGSPLSTARVVTLPLVGPASTPVPCSSPPSPGGSAEGASVVSPHDPLPETQYPVPRVLPTRAQVLELADDVEAAKLGVPEQQSASRIATLMKAERELLVIGLAVIIIAASLSVVSAWSVPTLRHFTTASWVEMELVLTLPLWICLVGTTVGEVLHAYVECRYVVVPWWRGRRYDARERRLSGAMAMMMTTNIGPDPAMEPYPELRSSHDGRRRGVRSLAADWGLTRLSPHANGLGGSGASTPARRPSHIEFDGAIAVAVEVTCREEVEDDPLDLPRSRIFEGRYGSSPMAASSSGGGLSLSGMTSPAIGDTRRREIWE